MPTCAWFVDLPRTTGAPARFAALPASPTTYLFAPTTAYLTPLALQRQRRSCMDGLRSYHAMPFLPCHSCRTFHHRWTARLPRRFGGIPRPKGSGRGTAVPTTPHRRLHAKNAPSGWAPFRPPVRDISPVTYIPQHHTTYGGTTSHFLSSSSNTISFRVVCEIFRSIPHQAGRDNRLRIRATAHHLPPPLRCHTRMPQLRAHTPPPPAPCPCLPTTPSVTHAAHFPHHASTSPHHHTSHARHPRHTLQLPVPVYRDYHHHPTPITFCIPSGHLEQADYCAYDKPQDMDKHNSSPYSQHWNTVSSPPPPHPTKHHSR